MERAFLKHASSIPLLCYWTFKITVFFNLINKPHEISASVCFNIAEIRRQDFFLWKDSQSKVIFHLIYGGPEKLYKKNDCYYLNVYAESIKRNTPELFTSLYLCYFPYAIFFHERTTYVSVTCPINTYAIELSGNEKRPLRCRAYIFCI